MSEDKRTEFGKAVAHTLVTRPVWAARTGYALLGRVGTLAEIIKIESEIAERLLKISACTGKPFVEHLEELKRLAASKPWPWYEALEDMEARYFQLTIFDYLEGGGQAE